MKSDLNLRLDFSIRDNKTLARKLIENVNQPVVGRKYLQLEQLLIMFSATDLIFRSLLTIE